MNRWQAWATRLRRRHGRIDAWGAQGAMVLRRGAGAPVAAAHERPAAVTHLHQHRHLAIAPRFMLTLRPVVAAPLTLLQAAPRIAAPATRASAAAVDQARARPLPSATVLAVPRPATPAFVPRTSAAARHTTPAFAQAPAAPHARTLASSVVGHAAAIVARLRRSAAREERPASASPALLAAPQHAGAIAAAVEAQAAVQAAARPPAHESRAVPAPAPAVDVESLTSLVIQQIDRRLVAYRERMGRA